MDFSGNLSTQNFKKTHKNQANITGVQYFFAYQQVESTLYYHLYSLHFTSSQFVTPYLLTSTADLSTNHHAYIDASKFSLPPPKKTPQLTLDIPRLPPTVYLAVEDYFMTHMFLSVPRYILSLCSLCSALSILPKS